MSNNFIKRIENLPPHLQELSVSNNLVDEIEPLRMAHTSLIHLGLAYNKVRNPAFVTIAKNFPNLFCLDLSFNELCDFRSALGWLEGLQHLKMLYL